MSALTLSGVAIETGVVIGRICHIRGFGKIPWSTVSTDQIVVVQYPGTSLINYLYRAGAIIAEQGSPGIEMAGMLRRFKKPAIFGVANALTQIPDATDVRIDIEERRLILTPR